MSRKIQFCCGANQLNGWENYDTEVNICFPLPFSDNCASNILIEHGLEHINLQEGFRFLCEARRILKPNGILRICVPILKRADRKYAIRIFFDWGHKMFFSETSLKEILWVAGFEKNKIKKTGRKVIDSHWKCVGKKHDDQYTLRIEAQKI